MFALTNTNPNFNDVIINPHMFVNMDMDMDNANANVGIMVALGVKLLIVYGYLKALSFVLTNFIFTAIWQVLLIVDYLFVGLWNSLTEGQEWIEIAYMLSTIMVTIMALRAIYNDNEEYNDHMNKIKQDLASKDELIAKLIQKNLVNETVVDDNESVDDLNHESLDNESVDDESLDDNSDDESVEYDDPNDSDYDPEDDEY